MDVKMGTRWGMSDDRGMAQLAPRENPYLGTVDTYTSRPYGEATAVTIDAEVQRIIRESREEAKRLPQEHRAELDALSGLLLDREMLDEEEILEVTG